MTTWAELMAEGSVRSQVNLAPMTTYKLGGAARWFLEATSTDTLRTVSRAALDRGLEIAVIGRGSNLLVADSGFRGLAIRLGAAFKAVEICSAEGTVSAGAAVGLPVLARRVAEGGWSGLEFYVGIPGTVGGAVRMNAGFYGVETVDVIRSASILDLRSGRTDHRRVDQLGLAYRRSGLGPDDVVLAAEFGLNKGDRDRILALMREAIRWRRDYQPGGTLNAGSVFRNPPQDSAGRIIDSLGLKGLRRGGAHISTKHANFFVVDAGATAQDVLTLVTDVHKLVKRATGIVLTPEMRFLGFDPEEVAPLTGGENS